MTLFKDIESGEVVTLDQLEKEFEILKKWDPATYDYNFDRYIENCLTRNNGTLKEIKNKWEERKMFTNESLKKVSNLIKEKISEYMAMDETDVKICISTGNRKIGRVLNVSLPPLFTCANCSGCKKYCYDIKACLQYPDTVIDARVRNYILAMYYPEKYFAEIRKKLSNRRKNKFFRWHVAGDIPNMEYLMEMVTIANEFPEFRFWTYTKNYKLVNEYCNVYGKETIPANLSIMFSEWKGMEMINPYNFPEFRCIMPDEKIPEGFTECPGNCEKCTAGKSGCPYGKNKFVHLH